MAAELDVVFATPPERELKLDIYRPDGPSNHVAIVMLHGGGWKAGAKDSMRPYAEAMAARGFVGLPVQYRLTGHAAWPAQLEDVKTAIRWVRSHAAELDIDPDRIVLWGGSAGGHLSLVAAGRPEADTKVAAVVAVYPPTGFHVGPDPKDGTTPAVSLMGPSADAERAREASPLTYVSADFPPTLLLSGTDDKVVHHSASEVLFRALRAVHAPVDLHFFHGHGHGFAAQPTVRAVLTADAAYFLDRTVVDPGKHRAEIEKFPPISEPVLAAPAPEPAA